MEVLLLSFAALVAGFVDAVAGGGGVIIFPTFLFLGIPISEIVGTNKLVGTAGTTTAAITFIKKDLAQKEILQFAIPCSIVGSLLGAITVLSLSNDFLKPFVSILVIVVAVYCYARPSLGIEHTFSRLTSRTKAFTMLAAFGIGFYDGFFGPGTGIFLAFFFINILGCDFLRATANTKVLNAVSNIIPLSYFLTFGTIRFDIGVPMLIANLIGGYLGAHTAISKGSRFIKWIYLTMAILTGLKLIMDL